MKAQPLRGVLFDLDGTLLDSVELIVSSFLHTVAAGGLKPMTRAEIMADFGRPLVDVFPEWSGDPGRTDELVQLYRSWNLVHHDRLAGPYPGIEEAVLGLCARGLQVGVVTSKGREAALRGVELCGLSSVMEVMVACDDLPYHKPHPGPVLEGCKLLGLSPQSCAYVGDAVVDMQAGRAAGVATVAATWGVEDPAGLQAEEPDLWLGEPAELGMLAPGQ